MKTSNRDLLVLLKDESMSNKAIEQEVEQLNDLLYVTESAGSFCAANELFDLEKFKIFRDQKTLVSVMHQNELKPFSFLFNKN
ncbi:MAG: hypothetical protein KIT80_21320 [Chitinophagaceae bacterium]|nr:hypothetical protein [Chitinophagaceae bacterium]MCW5929476.1 hypothetical protein [Chitinophagaceae bacterium]